MRHGVKSLRESWCRAECALGWAQDERGPPKAMTVAPLFAPEIGRTPFRVARKMAMLRSRTLTSCSLPSEMWIKVGMLPFWLSETVPTERRIGAGRW